MLKDYPFYLLNRAAGKYNADMDAVLRTIHMDIPHWRILMILNEKSPNSISNIAEMGVMKLSTVTKITQRMEKEGLVRIEPSHTDRRVTEVFITERGMEGVKHVKRVASTIYRQAFGDFSDSEIDQANALLRRIFKNLSRLPD
jgi:DNA-binding MarR family transcriptional regulator